jgi:hypothetical protein
MAVYFLVRALETKSRFYFFMAGGSLAAGIYTYLAFRFVPFVMLFFLLYVAVTQWRLLRSNIPGLAVYAASFLIVSRRGAWSGTGLFWRARGVSTCSTDR